MKRLFLIAALIAMLFLTGCEPNYDAKYAALATEEHEQELREEGYWEGYSDGYSDAYYELTGKPYEGD